MCDSAKFDLCFLTGIACFSTITPINYVVTRSRENMEKIKPLNNRVLVKRFKAQTSKGGIILPDTAQEKPKEGEVVAIGPGLRDEEGKIHPLTVKVGDRVLFTSYAGTEIKNTESDDEHLIMAEEDILGVLTSVKE
jgi:chaperonin GroES